MRILRVVALLLAGLVGMGLAPVPTARPPDTATLVSIRASHLPGWDRIVYQFEGGVPSSHQVRYVERLIADGSGLPVRVPGRAVLSVGFTGAKAHDAQGPTVLKRKAFALPNIMTTVRAGDFEGVTTYGIGLAKKTEFRVATLRHLSRVVIDIRAAFRTVDRGVFFLNRDNFVDNAGPYFTRVVRPVRPMTPATGVMDRLFAGPLQSEKADGLQLLRSHATGFADLVIADGVARVRLTGRCSSDGSTVTIAGEIMPTLRQFPSVDWVKIFSPAGVTGSPTGQIDSIPACLEP